MSNTQLLNEYARLQAELLSLRAQFEANYRSLPKQEDFPDGSDFLKALRARTERSQTISQAEAETANKIAALDQALISLALSLLKLADLPAAEIHQQLNCSGDVSSLLQSFVAQNLNNPSF